MNLYEECFSLWTRKWVEAIFLQNQGNVLLQLHQNGRAFLTFIPVLVRFRVIKFLIVLNGHSGCGCHSGGGGGNGGGLLPILLAFLLPTLLSFGFLLALGFLGGLGLFLSFSSSLPLSFSTHSLYLKDTERRKETNLAKVTILNFGV